MNDSIRRVNILVVEDDERLSSVIQRGLHKAGHVVDCVADGLTAKTYADATRYNVMVLDVMLPGLDGIALLRALRADGIETPILLLTARDTTEDLIAGLDAGADDYLRKPFVFAELNARLRAISRRSKPATRRLITIGDVTLDLATREVRRAGAIVPLTSRECAFLEYFMRHPGRIVTRAMLEEALWEYGKYIESNIVEVYVSRLRTKLRVEGRPPMITTLRGVGYRLA